MGYDIFLSETGQHLIIKVVGELSVESAWEFAVQMAKQRRNQGITLFLIDIRDAVGVESSKDYICRIDQLDNFIPDKKARAAIVKKRRDSSHSFLKLIVKHTCGRVRYFSSSYAAICWLGK
jgi:hypothetical protein